MPGFAGQCRRLAEADLKLDFAGGLIPFVTIGRVDAPGKTVLSLVVAPVRNAKLNAVKRLFKCRHHFKDHILMIVFLDAREIQIGREPALGAEEHLSEACAALKG